MALAEKTEAPQTFEVLLLNDYWPTEAEVELNPQADGAELAPPPNPQHGGAEIHIEPRFKAGMTVKLTRASAKKLVDHGKAERADWD